MSRSVVLSLLMMVLSAIAGAQLRGLPPAAELTGQIVAALHDDSTLANEPISVNVDESQIVLSGSVASRKQRQTADRVAESFAVNRKVVDKLEVRGENHPRRLSR